MLDVGQGTLLLCFKEMGVNAIECDVNRNVLRVNKKARPYLMLSRVENLHFKNRTFDLIVFHHVVEHLFSCGSFIEEAKRVLKIGGVIYIETLSAAFRGKMPLAHSKN